MKKRFLVTIGALVLLLASCGPEPRDHPASLSVEISERFLVALTEQRLTERDEPLSAVIFSPDVIHNAGNDFGLSLDPQSQRLGGDLLTLRGVDAAHARAFSARFSSANPGEHDSALTRAMQKACLRWQSAERGANPAMIVSCSHSVLNAAGTQALIAVGFRRAGGGEQAELYLLERGPDSWRVAASLDLDRSTCAY